MNRHLTIRARPEVDLEILTNHMKLYMIALISGVLGSVTAVSVHFVSTSPASSHNQGQQRDLQAQMVQEMLWANPSSPIPSKLDPLHLSPANDRGPLNFDRPVVGPQYPPSSKTAILVLVKTKETTGVKDPVWQLQLVREGKILSTLPALTGRADRQNHNRNMAGNKSPLPTGTYRIDRTEIVREKFLDPELGRGYWIPITPEFATSRSALGFHHDPSWGRNNGESGTSGCVGLRTPEDTLTLVEWIKHYNVHTLTVQS
jgi:hypothetical protein